MSRKNTDNDLWRQCVAWLIRCNIIPEGHKVSWPTTELNVFAKMLRSGVLLCKLMRFLEPNAIADFDRRPFLDQSIYCKNIQMFMDACRQFGLEDEDMFDPLELYNLTGLHKVLVFLSKLSLSSRAKRFHPTIEGFEYQTSTNDIEPNLDIYKDLHLYHHDLCYQADADEKNPNEEVYHKQDRQLDATSGLLEKRACAIQELVKSETNYLEVLNALRFKFMEPLQSMVAEDKLRIIFPCIGTLAEIHNQFLDRLRIATATTPPKAKLSQVILDFRKQFLVYGEYCAKLTKALDALRELTANNPDIDKQIQLCQKNHSEGRSPLCDILSVPMQRIQKYHLLLQTLAKETPHNHHDFEGLKFAHEAMIDVGAYANDVKYDFSNLEDIDQLSTDIVNLQIPGGNDLRKYGRLLHQGYLSIRKNDEPRTRDYYAFLFQTLLILVITPGNRFHSAINLAEYRLETRLDPHRTNELLLVRKSQSKMYTLCLKSEADCDQWSLKMQGAMESIEPLGSRNNGHKFALTTFDDPTICRICHKFLGGLVMQGYRCNACDIAVHKDCIMSTCVCKMQQSLQPVGDRQLEGFYWYVGEMTRDIAHASLIKRKVGTYLLRVRPQGVTNAVYALSMKTDERTIKHMKILQLREGDQTLFYLSDRRRFKTIVEQVSFYERNELAENFAGLNQSLQWPFKERFAIALYDFNPSESNQLPLRVGDKVLVIGKEGDAKGWWRGKSLGRVGFFPRDYVVEQKAPLSTDHME